MSEVLTHDQRVILAALERLGFSHRPPQPAWIETTMRGAAVLFVLLGLAAMVGLVVWVWRAAFAVGA